ncbi:hypothetical protein GN244_ATG01289 [Phytophthora infestans]|uniref:Uncharacterized protein n=1 Tax=Phytophthora infestans TaxID=4787 RepID=A0A833SDA8_PHYIN|nr:hypothetical protein GN244_ATG01289 [Phytophthora infestans]KAF4132011.1 hypothetical protein GN958_ATG18794 [Phytophthora infestans]
MASPKVQMGGGGGNGKGTESGGVVGAFVPVAVTVASTEVANETGRSFQKPRLDSLRCVVVQRVSFQRLPEH